MMMNPLYISAYALAAYFLYCLAPLNWKRGWLLAVSILFFCLLLEPLVWPVLALMVLGTHGAAYGMDKAATKKAGNFWLALGVLGNLSILILFKYLAFLAEILNRLNHGLGLGLSFSAPHWPAFIGVSYLAFQAVSYLLDIHFKTITREPSLFNWALHLCLFPKGIQGPIERAGDLLPQLKEKYYFNQENFRAGLLQMAWGLFKKTVVADRLAVFLDPVYADVRGQPGPALLLAVYAFAIQLFCDFSGYTDMALGAARLFNLRLTQNFNAPYLAVGMQDFWKRWHISLSNFILDYVFQPLQMLFRGWVAVASPLAIFVAFLAMGVWHGATWGFVAFGLIQGIYMACALFYRPYKKKLYRYLGVEKKPWLKAWQVLVTFHLVCFSFVFFKAPSVSDGIYVLGHLAGGWKGLGETIWGPDGWWQGVAAAGQKADIFILGGSLFVLLGVYLLKQRVKFHERPAWFRWAAYWALALALFFGGRFFAEKQFIYSQF